MSEKVDFKQIIREEYVKCIKDPSHFMNKYCYVQHPQRGRVLFNLYPFQSKVLNLWQHNQYNIVLKSRQLGISTLAAGYSLWLMLFHKDKNILCVATKSETAKNMVTKVRFMFEQLPTWLKIGVEENNRLSLRLSNGSQIKAVSAASDAGRSEAVSLLIVDEAAFIDNIEDIYTSIKPTISAGGGCLILSSPNGVGNWFHQTWARSEADNNDFLPIKLPWYVHPERNKKWFEKETNNMSPKLVAQEYECDFISSGDTVFSPEHIEFYEKTYLKEPIERRGVDKNLWIWESVDYNKNYMVIADVARGDGKDYSAFHIMDIQNNIQVGEYKGQLNTTDFGHLLVGIASEYNEALLVVENASIGWATIQTILDRGYKNFYYSPKSEAMNLESYLDKYDNPNNFVPGFTMSLKTRPMVISKMTEYFSEKSVIIQSKRLLEEMKTFIWKNGRSEAQQGYNDDLIMSFGVGLYVRDTALRFKQQNLDLTRAALDSFKTTKTSYNGVYSPSKSDNPYKFDVNGNNEDLRWLF
jgi:hypothetical protein